MVVMVERYIIRSIPRINELFGGGLPRESMVHLYGPYQSGKTLLIYQLLYELTYQGLGNALYIDTEASFRSNFSDEMARRFADRFGARVKICDVSIGRSVLRRGGKRLKLSEFRRELAAILDELEIMYDIEDLSDATRFFVRSIDLVSGERGKRIIYLLDGVGIESVLKFLDIDADIERKGGKTEVKIKGLADPLTSPLSKFIRKYKISFLVLDSLGMLVKGLAVSLSDLPARAVVTNLIVGGLIRLASAYKLIVIATNHESRNPAGKGFHSFYGGSAIGYGFKYSLYLSRLGKNRRRLVAERSPLLPDYMYSIDLEIRDDGFYEVEEGAKDTG